MKLKIDEFEALAKVKGYSNGSELWLHLDGGIDAYELAKDGISIGYEIVKAIYNVMGAKDTMAVIDFGKETFNGFKAKYVEVADRLY